MRLGEASRQAWTIERGAGTPAGAKKDKQKTRAAEWEFRRPQCTQLGVPVSTPARVANGQNRYGNSV
jgi:hypothetical protein